jgi:hypothetical protein
MATAFNFAPVANPPSKPDILGDLGVVFGLSGIMSAGLLPAVAVAIAFVFLLFLDPGLSRFFRLSFSPDVSVTTVSSPVPPIGAVAALALMTELGALITLDFAPKTFSRPVLTNPRVNPFTI